MGQCMGKSQKCEDPPAKTDRVTCPIPMQRTSRGAAYRATDAQRTSRGAAYRATDAQRKSRGAAYRATDAEARGTSGADSNISNCFGSYGMFGLHKNESRYSAHLPLTTHGSSKEDIHTNGKNECVECKLFKKALTSAKKQSASCNTIPAGCLVDPDGPLIAQESLKQVKIRSNGAESVGIIMYPNGGYGTCFRVGKDKIMTALHVIKSMLKTDTIENVSANQWKMMKQVSVDFSHAEDNYKHDLNNIFNLHPITNMNEVPFYDEETDCIVLQILPNYNGTSMPMPLTNFKEPNQDRGFHIIGHSAFKPKTFDHVRKVFSPGNQAIQEEINTIENKSREFLSEFTNVDGLVFDIEGFIKSNKRILFHCTGLHGASGAPGIVVDTDDKVYVVTMLLHAYPDWYYNDRSEYFRSAWPDNYRVEQGALMDAISKIMLQKNPRLMMEIFHHDYDLTRL